MSRASKCDPRQDCNQCAADLERRRIRRAQRYELSYAERMTRAIKNDLFGAPNELPRLGVLQHWFARVIDSFEQLDAATRAPRSKRK